MPSRKSALIVFAAFLLLLAVVLVFKPGSSGTSEPLYPTPGPKLMMLKAEEVTRIEVQSQEGKLILSKGTDGLWGIQAPVVADANQQTISSLLPSLVEMQIARSLPEGTSGESFGLEPPEFTVRLTADTDKSVVLEVGSPNPDGTKRYVRVQGTPIISMVFSYQLDQLKSMVTQPPLAPTPTATLEVTGTATPQS